MLESFHNYLRRSKDVLMNAGLQVTMNQTEMNVFITTLEKTVPFVGPDPLAIALVVILPISVAIVVILVVFLKRRKK
ncbi:MAG: hypothetical protein ACFE9Q_17230 [Candidatus Hodarchaeota archaeon]